MRNSADECGIEQGREKMKEKEKVMMFSFRKRILILPVWNRRVFFAIRIFSR